MIFLQFCRQRFYDSSLEEPPLDLARALGDILAMELKPATSKKALDIFTFNYEGWKLMKSTIPDGLGPAGVRMVG